MGHAWVLKVIAYGSNGQVRKRKDKKQSYATVKTKKRMGQASPYEVIPSQNEIDVFMNTNCSHGGFPMNLSFTYVDYFYSKFHCGRPVASADGTTDEDKGCSPSDGATFGSVRGGTTLASDPASTPSIGWMISS